MSKPWPTVSLGKVLTHYQEYVDAPEPKMYPKLSVKLYGKGVTLDTPADGVTLKMKRHQLAKAGQVILSEIWGKKGAIGLVPREGEGALCTSHFFLFDVCEDRIDRRWLQAIFDANYLQDQLDAEAKGTTGYAAVRPKILLACKIPLPPLTHQQRVLARIEELAAQIHEATTLRHQAADAVENLLVSKLRAVVQECGNQTRKLPFTEITKLQRRPVVIELDKKYREIGVYCFGKGIFHKPPRSGADVGGKDLYEIREGDFILQITFAWEGAVAVAGRQDDGLFGSVRYLTFRVKEDICSPRYLLTYMKTPEAIGELARISPGSAGRNRVLSVRRLSEVLVPIVPLEAQTWLNDELQAKVDALKRHQAETAAELDALLPAILDKAFKGELVPQNPNDEPASVLLERIKQQREQPRLKKSSKRQQAHVAGA